MGLLEYSYLLVTSWFILREIIRDIRVSRGLQWNRYLLTVRLYCNDNINRIQFYNIAFCSSLINHFETHCRLYHYIFLAEIIDLKINNLADFHKNEFISVLLQNKQLNIWNVCLRGGCIFDKNIILQIPQSISITWNIDISIRYTLIEMVIIFNVI